MSFDSNWFNILIPKIYKKIIRALSPVEAKKSCIRLTLYKIGSQTALKLLPVS
jgi:hypothetical protein